MSKDTENLVGKSLKELEDELEDNLDEFIETKKTLSKEPLKDVVKNQTERIAALVSKLESSSKEKSSEENDLNSIEDVKESSTIQEEIKKPKLVPNPNKRSPNDVQAMFMACYKDENMLIEMMNGKKFAGKIKTYDNFTIRLTDSKNNDILIFKQGISSIKKCKEHFNDSPRPPKGYTREVRFDNSSSYSNKNRSSRNYSNNDDYPPRNSNSSMTRF